MNTVKILSVLIRSVCNPTSMFVLSPLFPSATCFLFKFISKFRSPNTSIKWTTAYPFQSTANMLDIRKRITRSNSWSSNKRHCYPYERWQVWNRMWMFYEQLKDGWFRHSSLLQKKKKKWTITITPCTVCYFFIAALVPPLTNHFNLVHRVYYCSFSVFTLVSSHKK
jgi:hypothetical protein